MAALKRALAFEDVHDLTVMVAENLDLDVAGLLDEAFHVEGAITERGGRLAAGGADERQRILAGLDRAHAFPATPSRRFDEHRISEPQGRGRDAVIALIGGRLARDDRHAGAVINSRAPIFDPIRSMTSAGGPMKMRPADSDARANALRSERKP